MKEGFKISLVIVLAVVLAVMLVVVLVLIWKRPRDLSNDLRSGYLQGGAASYVYNHVEGQDTTLVWISGGGLASITFAFSGVGPYQTTDGVHVQQNPHMLTCCSQLFIDAGLWNTSDDDTYPTSTRLGAVLFAAILEAKAHLKLDLLVLCGVSYGGKLAVEVQRLFLQQGLPIVGCLGVTPFYEPYASAAYMPDPPERFKPPYYRGVAPQPPDAPTCASMCTASPVLQSLRRDFRTTIATGSPSKILSYMDEDGLIARYIRSALIPPLAATDPLNMWNVGELKEATLGDWSVPNQLRLLERLLATPSPEVRSLLAPLYGTPKPWLIASHGWSGPLMNSAAWEAIVGSGGYMESVNFQLGERVTAIGGTHDIICSTDGLEILRNNTPNVVTLVKVEGGTHLFPIAMPAEAKAVMTKAISDLS